MTQNVIAVPSNTDCLGMIKIHSDMWEDINKVYRVLSYFRDTPSTGVRLVLEDQHNTVIERVVPLHDIEWLNGEKVDFNF